MKSERRQTGGIPYRLNLEGGSVQKPRACAAHLAQPSRTGIVFRAELSVRQLAATAW
jgi:hypothetical protein